MFASEHAVKQAQHDTKEEKEKWNFAAMNIKDDREALPACTDGIADVAWSPAADFVAAASWDGQVRVWEVPQAPTAGSVVAPVAKAAYAHDGPVLGVAWARDGGRVFSGGADKVPRVLDLATGVSGPVAGQGHDAPIKCVRWMATASAQALVTASWDKTLKYWDTRSPTPMGTLALPERAYAMDVVGDLLVVATAERHVVVVNLANPMAIYKTLVSPLKWQTRSIACYHDASGFVIGSIEGRAGLQWIQDADKAKNFAFRCHRENDNAHAVNALSVHPVHGTFTTAGADGIIQFWDKEIKQRLDYLPTSLGAPISATAFSRTGAYFAYAISYDWSKGHEHYVPGARNALMVHATTDHEVKPRAVAGARRR